MRTILKLIKQNKNYFQLDKIKLKRLRSTIGKYLDKGKVVNKHEFVKIFLVIE